MGTRSAAAHNQLATPDIATICSEPSSCQIAVGVDAVPSAEMCTKANTPQESSTSLPSRPVISEVLAQALMCTWSCMDRMHQAPNISSLLVLITLTGLRYAHLFLVSTVLFSVCTECSSFVSCSALTLNASAIISPSCKSQMTLDESLNSSFCVDHEVPSLHRQTNQLPPKLVLAHMIVTSKQVLACGQYLCVHAMTPVKQSRWRVCRVWPINAL